MQPRQCVIQPRVSNPLSAVVTPARRVPSIREQKLMRKMDLAVVAAVMRHQ
jgi:hypothetical protein